MVSELKFLFHLASRATSTSRRLILGTMMMLSFVVPDTAHAQYTYGTNAQGGSCIANGVDCATDYSGSGQGGAVAPRRYAAFAVMKDIGTVYAVSYNQNSRAAAEEDAVARCSSQAEGKACEVAGWFYNTCGALSQDEGKRWGFAYSGSRHTAERQATKNCSNIKESKGDCKVTKSFCQ
jgi:hypothetical protein